MTWANELVPPHTGELGGVGGHITQQVGFSKETFPAFGV